MGQLNKNSENEVEQADNNLPPGFKLLPGERLIEIVDVRPRETARHHQPSSIREMLRLTKASRFEEIGKFGPTMASLALDAMSVMDSEPTPEDRRLYQTLFGRDSLIVAMMLKDISPELLRATVLSLAKLQGVEDNQRREEEPGKIVHEVRLEDDAIGIALSKNRGWDWPYYGSVDSTPQYVSAIHAYCRGPEENGDILSESYIDRRGHSRTIDHSLEESIKWIEKKLDSNPEGLLEYCSVIPKGIENQVWKDSWDSYHHADGTVANHKKGIASIEVQTLAYDALIDAAELYEKELRNRDHAVALRQRAEKLKQAILSLFWTEDKGGYFVLGTDRDENGNLRQLKVRASNMGHVLDSRLLEGNDPEIVRKREAIKNQLFTPEMQNASGIRTLASDEVRFRPGSYHNGSVWLWDTFKISQGLRRHEYTEEADILDEKLLNVISTTRMFPEYVRGDENEVPTINQQIITVMDEVVGKENRVEQPPQEVQAFSVAPILVIRRRNGIEQHASEHPEPVVAN